MRRLLIRPGAIGDFIVSLPALEHLRTDYTELWTTAVNAPLARFADAAISLYDTGIDHPAPGGKVLERLAAFDSIVSWYGANRPEFRSALRGLPVIFHAALPPSGTGGTHAVDFYQQQVGALPGVLPRLPVERRDGKFLAIHPFSGSPKKNWPFERFEELAEHSPLPVHWIAGPEEDLPGAVRFDNLWDLAQWLAGASLYIGNDSGITHLAAAAGVPVVAIFGPTDPEVWAPRGVDVQVLRAPHGRMESLATDQVLPYLRR
ncbi:MAG: glycosyltransferase family 9 protein [Bryobacterales bacterium]|nr:glycosyltransferase family 9 protein [Bryobacterales bacterium]